MSHFDKIIIFRDLGSKSLLRLCEIIAEYCAEQIPVVIKRTVVGIIKLYSLFR